MSNVPGLEAVKPDGDVGVRFWVEAEDSAVLRYDVWPAGEVEHLFADAGPPTGDGAAAVIWDMRDYRYAIRVDDRGTEVWPNLVGAPGYWCWLLDLAVEAGLEIE